jgi:hypothetical protein
MGKLGFLPVNIEKINEIIARAKKTKSNILPISIDIPATPYAPRTKANIDNIKKIIAYLNIHTS